MTGLYNRMRRLEEAQRARTTGKPIVCFWTDNDRSDLERARRKSIGTGGDVVAIRLFSTTVAAKRAPITNIYSQELIG